MSCYIYVGVRLGSCITVMGLNKDLLGTYDIIHKTTYQYWKATFSSFAETLQLSMRLGVYAGDAKCSPKVMESQESRLHQMSCKIIAPPHIAL
jgi:hypothetical protein